MTPQQIRELINEMCNDADGDAHMIGESLRFYSDGCPDEELAATMGSTVAALISWCEHFNVRLEGK